MALQYRFFASPQEAKEAFPNETPWGQNPALGEVALSCAVGAIAGFVEDLFLPNRNLCNDDYSHVRKHVASAFLSDRDQCGNRGNFVVVYGISKEELEAKAKMKLPERIVFDVRPQGILRQMLFACLRFEDEAFALNVKAGRSPAGYEEHGRQAFWHNAANGLIVHPLAEALKKATGFPEYTESYFWFGK
jgi:hypothetical protein